MRSTGSGLLVLLLASAGAGCASASSSLVRGRDFLLSPLEVVAVGADRVGRAPLVCLGSERRSEVIQESVFRRDFEPDGVVKEEVASESGPVAGLFTVVMFPFEACALVLDRFRFAIVTPFGAEPRPSRIVSSVFKQASEPEAEPERVATTVALGVRRPAE